MGRLPDFRLHRRGLADLDRPVGTAGCEHQRHIKARNLVCAVSLLVENRTPRRIFAKVDS